MHGTLLSFTLLILSASPPPDSTRSPDAPRPVAMSPLKQAIDGIWKDAAVASEVDYQKVLRQATTNPPAPLEMRRMVVDWPAPRDLLHWAHMSVGFEEERITLSWSGEIVSGEEADAANRRFAAALVKQGYHALDQAESEAFQKANEPQRGNQRAVYMRQRGDTEHLVSFRASPHTGSAIIHSGLGFTWFVRAPHRAAQPKLAEALAVLPAWMKVKYLDEKFYTLLADEPIAGLTSGNDFAIKFAKPINDKLIAALEQTGFEYQRELSPDPKGNTQKTWFRFADTTFAHVILSADGKQLRFFCQAPQRKGEPITKKPPPLHPSLRLPPEKRPILRLDELKFADGDLQRQTKLFHGLGEQVAGKDWQVQLYKDHRYSPDPAFTAYWQTSVVTSANYIMKVRPYQGLSISLQGKHADGVDQLNTMYAGGVLVPLEGWAAQVSYGVHPTRDGILKATLSATAGLARKDGVFAFDSSGPQMVRLTQQYVVAAATESTHSRYQFQTQIHPPDLGRSLHTLYGTPETLRDEVLADIAALRKQAREELEVGQTIKYFDMTNVRSDNPPREAPAAQRPPTAKTKEMLLAEIEKQLAEQETAMRENFQEIHAAVQQAFPLKPLLGELAPRHPDGPTR